MAERLREAEVRAPVSSDWQAVLSLLATLRVLSASFVKDVSYAGGHSLENPPLPE